MLKIKDLKKVLILFTIMFCAGCKEKTNVEGYEDNLVHRVGEVSQLHNGDAKFYDGDIYTSVGCLHRYDVSGKLLNQYDEIISNWIGIHSDVLVYGNFNHELGIVQFDKEKNIKEHHIIKTSDELMIDPTILKVDDTWYITYTTIDGTVNNADLNVPNGQYTVEIYKSKNLKQWEFISEIVSEKYNIEDTDLFYRDGMFYFSYEKEILDKGKSGIYITKSKDGSDWEPEQMILEPDADQEPAAYKKTKDGYILYYSSDKEDPGESYAGGQLYYAVLDDGFNIVKKDNKIITDVGKGILLYDVCLVDDEQYFLMSEDYFTDNNMIIESRKVK